MHVDGTCWRFGWFLHEITCCFVITENCVLIRSVAVCRVVHRIHSICMSFSKYDRRSKARTMGKRKRAMDKSMGPKNSRKDEHPWQIVWLPIKLRQCKTFFLSRMARVSPEFSDSGSCDYRTHTRCTHAIFVTTPELRWLHRTSKKMSSMWVRLSTTWVRDNLVRLVFRIANIEKRERKRRLTTKLSANARFSRNRRG